MSFFFCKVRQLFHFDSRRDIMPIVLTITILNVEFFTTHRNTGRKRSIPQILTIHVDFGLLTWIFQIHIDACLACNPFNVHALFDCLNGDVRISSYSKGLEQRLCVPLVQCDVCSGEFYPWKHRRFEIDAFWFTVDRNKTETALSDACTSTPAVRY